MKQILAVVLGLFFAVSSVSAFCPGKEKRSAEFCPGKEKRTSAFCPGKDK